LIFLADIRASLLFRAPTPPSTQSRRFPLVGLAAAPLNGAAAPALADLPDADRQILAIDAKIAALDEKYEVVMAATRPFEDAREVLSCKLDGWGFRPVNGLPAPRSTLSVANTLRAKGNDLPGDLLRHVALQIWGHINLIGTYDRSGKAWPPSGEFRQLRVPQPAFLAA